MTLAEFIQELANRVDFNVDDDQLKAVVTTPILSQIQAPISLAQALQSKLMTEDDAKTNPNINNHFKKHYIGTALKTVDSKLIDVLNSLEFDDNYKNEIANEQNTYNKLELIASYLKNNKSNNKSDIKNTDLKEYLAKIQELQSALEFEKESRQWYIDDINQNWQNKLSEKEINSIFSQYNYAVDIDKDIAAETARRLVEKKLNEKGAKYIYNENGISLVNAETPDLPFTIDNKKIDFKNFVDSVLSENKLLKVNSDTPQPIGQPINDISMLKNNQLKAPAATSQTKKAIADFIAGS